MGILFSLLSYALDGTVNFIDKFLVEKYHFPAFVIALYSGFFAFLISICIIAVTGLHILDMKTACVFIASGFLTQLFLIPYFKALSMEETSRVVPFFQLVPVMVLLFGYFFLHEVLTTKQYFGAACIVLASIALSLKKPDTGFLRMRPALWFILLADLCTASAIVLFKIGIKETSFVFSLPYEGLGIALCALCLLAFPTNLQTVKKTLKITHPKVFISLSVNETVYLIARYSRFFATSLIPVSIVSILGGSQQFFVLFFGIILTVRFPKLINEVITKETIGLKLFACLIVLIGLLLIFT